jgi:hypothetical protein
MHRFRSFQDFQKRERWKYTWLGHLLEGINSRFTFSDATFAPPICAGFYAPRLLRH